MLRVGIGTDRHLLVGGRRLILGGVLLDYPKGCAGFSDGDVLTHAVIDALLGAAGLGDIGHHFPETDPKWKNADSIQMLKEVVQLIATQGGGRPVCVDCVLHLQQPKLGRLKQEMAGCLAAAIGLPRHMVNVKAKTGEGVGEVGRGEIAEALAVAMVEIAESK
jgi:2-C-methyl-D-erythritol 2,4-cyclodiphosphate synthase